MEAEASFTVVEFGAVVSNGLPLLHVLMLLVYVHKRIHVNANLIVFLSKLI